MIGGNGPFEPWLERYLALRARAAQLLGRPLPAEITELLYESQQLEPLRYELEEARSFAELHVLEGKTARKLWAWSNAKGLCAAAESRAFKVAQHIKRLDKNVD